LRAAVDAAAVREGSGQAGTRAGVLEPPPGAGYMCHYDAFRELERLQNVVGRMHDAGKEPGRRHSGLGIMLRTWTTPAYGE